ncbi:MAG: FAD-dependent monooxygenase [Patescibacteria group bacterium]|jgi:flavin-dependent dehydrogenase
MPYYDVCIVGASFSGLTLAHHLPKELKVLILDVKPEAGATVESTGLITSKTRTEFSSFFPVDSYITNPISAIAVIAPGLEDMFVSTVSAPWIYQTDTKALVKALADRLPLNVTLRTKTAFIGVDNADHPTKVRIRSLGAEEEEINIAFLVGADGGHSKVAETIPSLSKNTRFLFGYEQVFFGNVLRGPKPSETIYHYWFGEFSLGYGGWLSPTVIDGKPAFRIGLAKLLKDRGDAKQLTEKFLSNLIERGDVVLTDPTPHYVFGSHIPINGIRQTISHNNTLLIGDAAGFCGAFAADGIKGSVISGKEAAILIPQYLRGNIGALSKIHARMDSHGGIIGYYRKQLLYRYIWDAMQKNRTFRAMFDIIAAEHETFLAQFCDSKDKHKSLVLTVVKWRHAFRLLRYAFFWLIDGASLMTRLFVSRFKHINLSAT